MSLRRIKTEKTGVTFIGIVMCIISILWFVPVYFMVINSFKPFKEVALNTAGLPKMLYLKNFSEVWERTQYWQLFRNSIFIGILSIAGIVLCGSMAGYWLSRSKSKWSTVILSYFILTLVIPFQAIMIPLVKVMRDIHFIDSQLGLIMVYIAMGSPLAIFLYQASVKSIPDSLEEAAKIDGAGYFRIFFIIIFPLLGPITSTVVILQSLYIWNDFLLPLIILQSETKKTIPLGVSAAFFGQYSNRWNLGITSMFLASMPMIILYVFMQKYIVNGIVGGSVKG